MKNLPAVRSSPVAVLFLLLAWPSAAAEPSAALRAGNAIQLKGGTATITRLDSLPLVENQFTRRFKFDSFDNPKLKQLREHYKLDEVVAPGKDEFERQVLLLDWVNHQFKKFGKPTANPRGAAEILHDVEAGHTFFCAQYADTFVSAAASLGWIDRPLALRRPDNVGSGSTEHSSTEIWSNQLRKWVMLDPTFAMHVEKNGVPLSALEIRQEWFEHDARDIVFVLGKDRQKFHKSDMPVFRQRYPGFGDLSLDGGAVNVYAFIGYIPNTDLMDSGPDYGRMFIWKDKLCDGTSWHKRDLPPNPSEDCYFPIGQAALTLTADGQQLRASFKTLTPNFKTYRVRIDGGAWQPSPDSVAWPIHPGKNVLEAETANQFGVEGPISSAEVVQETSVGR